MAKQNGAGFSKPVMVAETGEVYASRKKAAQALGCSDAAVYNAIKNGEPIDGYHLLDASGQLPADTVKDAVACTVEAREPSPPDSDGERGMLLKQLEIKDGQIENLQASISFLLAQLKDKDTRLHQAEAEIDKLRLLHAQQLDNMQGYYTKALSRYEKEANMRMVTAQTAPHPLSRREALRIALFGNSAAPQRVPDEKEA